MKNILSLLLCLSFVGAWGQAQTDAALKTQVNSTIRAVTTPNGVTRANLSDDLDDIIDSKPNVLTIYDDPSWIDSLHWNKIKSKPTTISGYGITDAQSTLVSGTSIKTVNSTSLLGSGNVAVQSVLVSGTDIKTLESVSLLGSGNIDLAKGDVGLGNVDNTSDANKPVSTAQQTAIDGKVAQTITNGVTTSAPSQDAVYDALAAIPSSVASLSEVLMGTDNTKVVTPLRLRSVTPRVYNVEAYGAVHDGKKVYNGAITSGTAILTSASNPFSASDVGKIIVVSGAGAAGVALKTTILSYQNAGQVTLAANASTTPTNAHVTWGTDDTVAIQAANDACFAAGGGTVYFPNGIYIIDGPLQTSVDGVNPNSQLYLKSHQLVTVPYGISTVKWLGEERFPMVFYADPHMTGVILLSTLTTSSGTRPSVIGTKGLSGNYLDFNHDHFSIENIAVLTHSNKGTTRVLSGLNASDVASGEIKGCVFTIDSDVNSSTTPSAFEHFGAWLARLSDNGPNLITNSTAAGYKYGWVVGEHTQMNNVMALANLNGYVFIQGNYSINGYIQAIENTNNILIPDAAFGGYGPGSAYLDLICEVEVPIGSTWFTTTTHLIDAGNRARGQIKWLNSNDGTNTILTSITGGAGINKVPFNSVLAKQVNQAGGLPTQHAQFVPGTTDASLLELGTGVSTSNDTKFAILTLATTQTGTSNVVGVINAINPSIGGAATERRMWNLLVSTNGATNTGIASEFVMGSGTLSQISAKTSTSIRHAVNTYIGGVATTPTARLHLAAGTTAASTAPLKFTSGSLLTSAEAGAFEFLTDIPYITITTGTARKEFTLNDAPLTSGTVPVATTNGRLTNSGITSSSGLITAMPVDKTITPGGTTGNQTINKLAGTVNIAAAGTTVTVTNSLCTTSSIVLVVVRTNDATAYVKNVVPGSGSFVINLGAAATAEVSIGFKVVN